MLQLYFDYVLVVMFLVLFLYLNALCAFFALQLCLNFVLILISLLLWKAPFAPLGAGRCYTNKY